MKSLANLAAYFKNSSILANFAVVNRISISLFILFYFTVAFIWCWANFLTTDFKENKQSMAILQALSPLCDFFGWHQSWGFFSPNVRDIKIHTLAVISLQNGFLKLVEMPRIENLLYYEKTQRQKYRKIFNDGFPYSNLRHVRPTFSRFLARTIADKYNPPTRIAYFLISEKLCQPTEKFADVGQQLSEPEKKILDYFDYGVSPQDYQYQSPL